MKHKLNSETQTETQFPQVTAKEQKNVCVHTSFFIAHFYMCSLQLRSGFVYLNKNLTFAVLGI